MFGDRCAAEAGCDEAALSCRSKSHDPSPCAVLRHCPDGWPIRPGKRGRIPCTRTRLEREGRSVRFDEKQGIEPLDMPKGRIERLAAVRLGKGLARIGHFAREFGHRHRRGESLFAKRALQFGTVLRIEQRPVDERQSEEQGHGQQHDRRTDRHAAAPARIAARPTTKSGHSRAMVKRCGLARHKTCAP